MFKHILEDVVMPSYRSYQAYDPRTVGLVCDDPSLTVQSQKDEADINTIVRNFGLTGHLPVGIRPPTYGDFEGVDDYRSAIHAIRDAEAAFMAYPAEVRTRFENDPQQFLDFCMNRANLEEMRKLGLAVPAVPEPPESAA